MKDACEAGEHQLRTIVDRLPVGVWLTDAAGRIILSNPAAARIWGEAGSGGIEECVRRPGWWHGTGRRIEPKEWAPIRALSNGETYVNEVIDIESGDGSRKTISHSAIPVRDDENRISGIVVINEDITERKRVEQRLRESDERHRRITQALSDYVYTVWISEGRVVATEHGAACEAVTGYTRDDFASNPYLWLRMVVEEDRSAVLEQGHRLLAGERAAPIEHRIVRKDGRTRWVRNTPVPCFNAQGRPIYYDGVIQDITDRRLWQERIARFAADNSSVPACWVNAQGRILYGNQAARSRLGCSEPELTVLGIGEFDPALDSEGWVRLWSELRAKGNLARVSVLRSRDSGDFSAEVFWSYLEHDGTQRAFVFVKEDQTGRMPGASEAGHDPADSVAQVPRVERLLEKSGN
jgi:PAS domain S-box-containing protein